MVYSSNLQGFENIIGVNPCPADIDLFWDESVQEMRQIDPCIEYIPAEFSYPSLKAFDLYYTGVHNARIHARLIIPQNTVRKKPAVCFFHGYASGFYDWSMFLPYACAGFVVAAMDCRGQGGLSEDVGNVKGCTVCGHLMQGIEDPDPKKMLYRELFLDAAQLAGILMDMDEVDATRVATYGGSQGGGLALACAALENRVARVAVEFPFLCDYQTAYQSGAQAVAYEGLRKYFRYFDPQHKKDKLIFQRLGYIDVQHLVYRIKAKVLFGTGLLDVVCPPETQFAAYNKIISPKEIVLYPDYGHEQLPGFSDMRLMFLREM